MMLRLRTGLKLIFVVLLFTLTQTSVSRMPFYVIGHMANDEVMAQRFLQQGANAIEADVIFSRDGFPTSTYHGFPCDCWRFCFRKQDFGEYLRFVRSWSLSGETKHLKNEFALLYLDLKTSDIRHENIEVAGRLLADVIIEHLIADGVQEMSKLPWVVLGVPGVKYLALLSQFKSTLVEYGYEIYLDKFGYDIYYTKVDKNLLQRFEDHNLTNLFLGDGTTNCLSTWKLANLDLIRMRDNRQIDAVHFWTIDNAIVMRFYLRYKPNGIMTNWPSVLLQQLEREEFANKYRLARLIDRPWS